MKLVVLDLVGAGIEQLENDEDLVSLRGLAASGCFGHLEPHAQVADLHEEAICAQVARSGNETVLLPEWDGMRQQGRDAARLALESENLGFLRLGLSPLTPEATEPAVAQILDLLDDDTALLVVLGAHAGDRDGFVLAAPAARGPLGEMSRVTLPDLAVTLLAMAGYAQPDGLEGRSLLAGDGLTAPDQGYAFDEEAQMRSRLEGLGYIG